MTTAVNGGTYYFESRSEGGLISNNANVHGTTANSYIEVDLTQKTGVYTYYIDYIISSETSYDYGYITVTQNTNIPTYDNQNGRVIIVSGATTEAQCTTKLFGGRKYYIHLGYRKDGSANSGSDCFIIKSINYKKFETDTSLIITSGIYECTKAGNSNQYWATIENDSNLVINGGTIKSTQGYCYGIRNGVNNAYANLEINDGKIICSNCDCIGNYNNCIAILNKCNIQATNSNGIYNTGILKTTSEDVKINANQGIVTDSGGETTIEDVTCYGNSSAVLNYSNCNTVIKNGKLSSNGRAIYNSGSGTIKVENAEVLYASNGVYQDSTGTIIIDNIDITATETSGIPKASYGIYNSYSGRIIVNDANIFARYKIIDNYRNGYVEINGGTFREYESSYPAITVASYDGNANATLTINGGHIIGKKYGVYGYNNGSINIYGGFIEATNDDSRAVECGTRNVINIGKNDGTVSTESPKLKSEGYVALNFNGKMNFYDGVLIGKHTNYILYGTVDDIPEGYEIVKEIKDDGYTYVTLGIPTDYVAKIAESDNPDVSTLDTRYYKLEDGYYYFITVNSAVEACSKTNHSTIELIDDAWIYRKIIIDEDQDITIKFNSKCLYVKCALDIENNGKLKLTNEGVEELVKSIDFNHGNIMKNNENAVLEMDSILMNNSSTSGLSNNYRKIIHNFGDLKIKDSKFNLSSWDTYFYAYDIYNEATGIVDIDNLTLNTNSYYPIINLGVDRVDDEENTIYSMSIKNSTFARSKDYVCGLQNNGTGTLFIDKSSINFTYDYHYNNSTGTIIVSDSTVTRCISNKLSGKIIIKGNDSYVNRIDNQNVNGIVEIQGGRIYTNEYWNTIENKGKLIITGGTVENECTGSSSYGAINNYNNAVTTITGDNTKIIGYYRGIENAGTVNVLNGSIQVTQYSGINNNASTAKVYVGDSESELKLKPRIKGGTYGVYNSNGKAYFYDGIIEGKNDQSFGPVITEIREDYTRVIYKGEYVYDDGSEDGYNVVNNKEISVLEQINVAHLESTNQDYPTLKSAFANMATNDKITIINDATITNSEESLEIPEGYDITLDLNGKSILAGNANTFVNNGTFRIDDTADTETVGNLINGTNNCINNNGELYIEDGNIKLTAGGDSNNYRNLIYNTGNIQMNGGTLLCTGSYVKVINCVSGNINLDGGVLNSSNSYSYTLYNSDSIIEIDGATVRTSGYYAIYHLSSNKTLTIKSGTISGEIRNQNTGTIDILNGTMSSHIYNERTGIINIRDGNITGLIENYTGTINIYGGKIYNQGDYTYVTAVLNAGAGTINIYSGDISCRDIAVRNSSSGIINIDGTECSEENPIKIKGIRYNNGYGIYAEGSGTINIKGHVEIDATGGSGCYAIYRRSGIVKIGELDNFNNDVKIKGESVGIHNSENTDNGLYYYGGIITSGTAVYGYITEIPEGYNIIRSVDDDGKEVYELARLSEVASCGENVYDTLKDAINQNSEGTIKLLKNIILTKSDIHEISSDKNLILDLNSNNIKLHTAGAIFKNYGEFKITDESDENTGLINGMAKRIIYNEGNFEFAGGTIRISQIGGEIYIQNSTQGNLLISGGLLDSKVYSSVTTNVIYSNGSGKVEMTGGTINLLGYYYSGWWSFTNSTTRAIYTDNASSIVDIIGGTIKYENSNYRSYTWGVTMNAGGTVNAKGDANITTGNGIAMFNSGTINVSEDVILDNSSRSINVESYTSDANIDVNITGGKIRGNCYGYVPNVYTAGKGSHINIYEDADIENNVEAISSFRYINIYGGSIKGSIKNPYNEVNMYGGTIEGTSYGISVDSHYSPTIIITGGSITATSGPGIEKSLGVLTLGENTGGYPSTTVPSITGSTYGVQNNGGTFNFYDGILKGSTYATSGVVTQTPELFKVLYSVDGTTAVLGIESTFEQIATVNGIFYDSMQSALDAAISVDGVIEMCKDVMLTSPITIPEGKEITIDLAGHTISGYTEDGNVITNNGTLNIIDLTDEGTNESGVTSYNGCAIINNGILNIGINDENHYTNAPIIKGTSEPITGSGTLNMYDGKTEIEE